MTVSAFSFFENMANSACSQNSVKLAKNSDFSDRDAQFILKYADKSSSVLDLGSGTGLIINKIYDKIRRIVAVEPFKNFTDFIVNSDNIEIVNMTFDDFDTDEQFDLITIFGTMHYFVKEDAGKVYKKFRKNLARGGRLIVKNQFGVTDDVTIDGWSEELKQNYFAQYRYIGNAERFLESCGYANVRRFDIYPPECNRWENTHFYAVVAEAV